MEIEGRNLSAGIKSETTAWNAVVCFSTFKIQRSSIPFRFVQR
jgi:hypothetical protein